MNIQETSKVQLDIKTLYYTRTESVLRGDIAEQAMDESCLSCDG